MLTTGDCSVLVLDSMLARYAALSSRLICIYLVLSVLLCAMQFLALCDYGSGYPAPRQSLRMFANGPDGPRVWGRDAHVPVRPRERDVSPVKNASWTRALDGRLILEDAFVFVAHPPPPRYVTVKEDPRENI